MSKHAESADSSKDEVEAEDVLYALEETGDTFTAGEIEDIEKPVYYSAINTFESRDSSYLLRPEDVRREVMETAGIVSPEEIIQLFTPKIPVEKEYGDS